MSSFCHNGRTVCIRDITLICIFFTVLLNLLLRASLYTGYVNTSKANVPNTNVVSRLFSFVYFGSKTHVKAKKMKDVP